MTLKFYSAKAYKFVRKSFNLGLPHPSVIRSWYNVMVGEPGFTKEAMTALKAGADQFSFDRRGAKFSGGVHWCTTKCMKFD